MKTFLAFVFAVFLWAAFFFILDIVLFNVQGLSLVFGG
jgi:hypothetical protein